MKTPNHVHEANLRGFDLINHRIEEKRKRELRMIRMAANNCPEPGTVWVICTAAKLPQDVDLAFEIYEAAMLGWTDAQKHKFETLMRAQA